MITEVQVILFSYNGVDIGISKKLLISSFKFLDAKRADFSALHAHIMLFDRLPQVSGQYESSLNKALEEKNF